jgi:dihydrofolate synthase/folylpolyglutamate synthase
MTYDQAIAALQTLGAFGMRSGLDTARTLARLAGDPHRKLRFIHVAGTNGKGSTCAMLENIYRIAGLRAGLYTSPHLVRVAERIQVNRHLIPDHALARLTARIWTFLPGFPPEAHPTFFEVLTLMALEYFAEERCDVVIWETGLGGRLDATNIVTPLASVITNVHFDHEQYLGSTLASIATEKAGIIKPGVPVITTCHEPEALDVIRAAARTHGSPLTEVPPKQETSGCHNLPLLGQHQRINAALAAAVVETLQARLPVPAPAIARGLETVVWAGRFQRMERRGQTLVLDGAHNPHGAQALASALAEQFTARRPTLIFGALADKNWARMCEHLAPMMSRIWLVPVATSRGLAPEVLLGEWRRQAPHASVAIAPDLGTALQAASADPLLVIAGSLYLVGEACELLGLDPRQGPDSAERGLNDWSSTPATSHPKSMNAGQEIAGM